MKKVDEIKEAVVTKKETFVQKHPKLVKAVKMIGCMTIGAAVVLLGENGASKISKLMDKHSDDDEYYDDNDDTAEAGEDSTEE